MTSRQRELFSNSVVLPNLLENLLVFGKASALAFIGVDNLIVKSHLEDAATSFFQIHRDVELLLNCGRQTGGLSKVTSLDAVGDLDVDRSLWVIFIAHNESPFCFSFLQALSFPFLGSFYHLVRFEKIFAAVKHGKGITALYHFTSLTH